MNRRHFFLGACSAAAATRVFGANDRLQLAIIGLGGRARWLLKNEEFPGVDLVAFADCFAPRLDLATAVRPAYAKVNKYADYRQMFEKEKLNGVFVETPTHARVRIAMQALEAGIDVYAEKPMALTIAEGRMLERAVRHHKRILQTGTQQRSIPINAWASKFVREGGLGKIKEVIACNFEPPTTWTEKPAMPLPAGLNWDEWCNQTELRPYHDDLRLHWNIYRDYDDGGQSWGVSGWGTHALDQIQCALGTDDTGPVELWTEGEGPQAPVIMRYASGTLLKCVGKKRPDHSDLGGIFVGEKGTLEIKRGTLVTNVPELLKGRPEDTVEGPGEDKWHLENFFECIRTRKRPNADVEIGQRSTSVCHLMTICRDLGRKLSWDPKAERFPDADANAMLSRPRRKGYELPKI
jgi:predicted dehydrogenase